MEKILLEVQTQFKINILDNKQLLLMVLNAYGKSSLL